MGGGGGDNEIKETDAQREAQRVAVDQWNWHVTKGKPFENAFVARAAQPTAAAEGQAAGAANADVAQALGAATQRIDPNKGSAMLTPHLAAAKAVSSAIPRATQAVDDYRTSLVRGYTEMLRGGVPNINQGYLREAQSSGEEAAASAGISQRNRAMTQNAIGSGAGAIAGASAGIYANTRPKPGTLYSNDMSLDNAQMTDTKPLW